METDELLVPYCKAADYNATTGECVAVFWGPKPGLPALSVAEGIALSAVIGGAWAIGFFIKQARRTTST
ncbi:hypothetical protein [Luteimonas sp. R10]|uniref:hypothetical protein n=1 Tax=Luteimonas sp. R10 TaxID=3108176 RepID=UPI00308D84D5|nr:hypothetical protein U3649_11955 [Luteimonas sp. R10]